MTGIVTVYATFASDEEAGRISHILVEERLAACANILGGCRSIYRWEGKIEDSIEVAALFKTRACRADALIARLAELHSYAVPAAVVWPIEGVHPAYAAWVESESAKVT
ncbi:MAG TPA: divalent-cation tolerance protein CutA [Allosphingosinicella sp.]|jgi:periplasmic divalent cation tolerance protein|nr:divalent-cation tolerance protein CutA [Allosphingosinicella sp.]